MRRDLPLELCDAIDDALGPDPAVRPAPAGLRAELRAAQAELTDEGGLVEPATLRRVGLPSTGSRRGLFGRQSDGVPRPAPRSRRARGSRPAAQPTGLLGRAGASPPASKAVRLAQRAAAGLLAGALVLAVLSSLGPEPAFSKLSAAAVAAGATALLPDRLDAVVLGLCVWLVAPETDRQGTAVVLAAAALPIPFLLPRGGTALGQCRFSARCWAPSPSRPLSSASLRWRHALAPRRAAAGLWWLVPGRGSHRQALLFGSPDGTLPRAD